MKPRILHVIDHTGSGGAQVVVQYLTHALQDVFDFSVAVLGKTGTFSDAYRSLGVPVIELGSARGRWSLLPFRELVSTIQQGQYNLAHTHLFKSNILGTVAATWAGTATILHDHSDTYAQALEQRAYFSNRLSRLLYLSGYRYALSRCDKAIVLTPATLRSYVQAYSMEPERITVLPNSVDLRRFELTSEHDAVRSIRNELGLPSPTRLVLMIGRLEPVKDWWSFLQVARQVLKVSDLDCAFLAIGSGLQETELQDQVRQMNLDRVFLLGYREDIPTLLQQADVFLFTPRREAFGIVVLEAMAAGCPVVATRSGGPNSILTDDLNGLLADVGDVKELASHVMRLLRDDALCQRLIKHGRQTVLDAYSVEQVSARMADIYRQVLAK